MAGTAGATSGPPGPTCRPWPPRSARCTRRRTCPSRLVGWSRGGIIAREAARLAPDAVRMVITLGSPFAAPAATNVTSRWRLITGESFMAPSAEQMRRLALPLPVPTTSIYSRADGVVAWQACLEAEGPRAGERRGPRLAYRPGLQSGCALGYRRPPGPAARDLEAVPAERPDGGRCFRARAAAARDGAAARLVTFPRQFLIRVKARWRGAG